MMSKASYLKKWWTAGSKLLLLAALALPVGCDTPQEQPERSGSTPPFTLTATLEQPGESDSDPATKQNPSTKTSLGALSEGTRPVLWSNGDQIWVLSGSALDRATVMSTTSTGTNASFAKEFGNDPDPDINYPYYAFYPYPRASMFEPSNQNFTVTLNDQNYVANSFGANAAPMTAYTSDGSASMAFKNVYGLLRLKFTGATDVKVNTIRVTSNAGEFLSGNATINHNNGTPTVAFSDASNRSTSVTLNCITTNTPNGVSLSATDTPFYIALPPTISTTVFGYTVEVFTNKGRMTKTMPSTVASGNKIERSKILSMASLPFTADPPANCYIVAPNTTGFTYYVGDAISPASVRVLWESGSTGGGVVSSASFDSGTKRVTITTEGAGNAVIAAYDNADPTAPGANILWSWHIWVTDYTPNNPAGQCVYSTSGATMMDRNLGALSNTGSGQNDCVDDFGLLYQWGRKDPFIGSGYRSLTAGSSVFASTVGQAWGTASVTTAAGSDNALAYSIAHPMDFITNNADPYDWYGTTNHDSDLWKASKTPYDPCPAGWKVPNGGSDGGVWAGLTAGTFWYPTAGYRKAADGDLFSVGSLGYYWSCSIKDSNKAYLFYLNSSATSGNNSTYRAYGLSVRCQKI